MRSSRIGRTNPVMVSMAGFFCVTAKSGKTVQDRFPHKRPVSCGPKPALPVRLRVVFRLLPLRSDVVGTYGSPTNAPSQNAVQGFVIGSACAAAFFHRGIIPLLTLFFSASGSQKTAVTPLEEGRQMPSGLPPLRGAVPWQSRKVGWVCRGVRFLWDRAVRG